MSRLKKRRGKAMRKWRIHTTAFTSLVARFAIRAVPNSTSFGLSPRSEFTATWKRLFLSNEENASNHGTSWDTNFLHGWSHNKLTVILKIKTEIQSRTNFTIVPAGPEERTVFRKLFNVLQNDSWLWKLWRNGKRRYTEKVRITSYILTN